MQAGKFGGEDRKDDKGLSESEKLELSVCDVSSDEFKKAWLTLKELHDKELHRLQTKLTNLRKERLGNGRWTGSTARIKELTEQQKVLNATIQALREQLRSKTCDRCSVNETYKSTLQKEFYDIQQRNLKFIAEITAERNKLREENKMLSEKLRVTQQKLSSSNSSDDLIPCAQKAEPVFTARDPTGDQLLLPMRLKERPNTAHVKSREKKEQQHSQQLAILTHSPDLFDLAETSYDKVASNNSKSTTEGTSTQKTPTLFPLLYTQSTQREHEFQGVSNLSEEKPSRSKKLELFTQKASTQRASTQMDFPWTFSNFGIEQSPVIEAVSETSEENMPFNRRTIQSYSEKKQTISANVFPLDYTSRRKRSSIGIPRYNIGYSERSSSYQIPSIQQSTSKKNTNESTVATGYGTDRLQGDDQSSIVGSRIKRKAKPTERRK